MTDANEVSKEITRLSAIWYEFVNLDHHKDRDCHWFVETKFSYGNPPRFMAYHYGYVADEWFGPERATMLAALIDLRDKLRSLITDTLTRTRAEMDPNHPSHDNWGLSDREEIVRVLSKIEETG